MTIATKHDRRVLRRRPGFSLAELMIALAILLIGVLTIGAALPIAMQKTRQVTDRTTGEAAVQQAQELVKLGVGIKPTVPSWSLYAQLSSGGTPTSRYNASRLFDHATDEAAREMIYRPRFGGNSPTSGYPAPWSADPAPSPLPTTDIYPGALAYEPVRIFNEAGDNVGVAARAWEPWIKVRPLITENIYTAGGDSGTRIVDMTARIEAQIEAACDNLSGADRVYGTGPFEAVEFVPDDRYFEWDDSFSYNNLADRWQPWALPAFEMVYPGVAVEDFVADSDDVDPREFIRFARQNSPPRRPIVEDNDLFPAMFNVAKDRRYARVVFYRRAQYDQLIYDPETWAVERVQGTSQGSDSLYEIVTVTVRRLTDQHRFAVPDVRNWDTETPAFEDDVSALLPVPVLVTFPRDGIPWLEAGSANDRDDYWRNAESYGTRRLNPDFTPPATLNFEVTPEVGALLPPGSIFIPAANDEALSLYGFNNPNREPYDRRISGFVPHTADALPIYRVLERKELDDGDVLLVVENNGFYPWTDDGENGGGDAGEQWPVWVIPPAFAESTSDGDPIFESNSSIVAISRRTVNLRAMWYPTE